MREYKIITNGVLFKVESKIWYWPFWVLEPRCDFPYTTTKSFTTIEEAKQYIQDEKDDQEYYDREWKEATD